MMDQSFPNNFWERSLKEHCEIIEQAAPIHQSYVYWWIKLSRAFFEKGHPRNIPVKLFQNLTSGFREEDFFKNFFMSI